MRRSILCLVLVLAVSITVVPYQIALASNSAYLLRQATANELIAAVNSFRIANGLPAYTVNSILMQVAQDQANYMAATGQVAHRPGLTQRMLNAGYPLAGDLSQGGFRAENITGGNKTAAQAVQEWTGDALHTNTMLSPNLTEIGAGVAKVGNTYYMVIDCAQPTTGGVPQAFTPSSEDSVTESFAPGDFIVPILASTPDENGLVYHEVQYGQTLWAIAIEYGVKIDEIRALNNLGPGTDIYQGDRLLVRKEAPLPPATATFTAVTLPTDPILVVTSTSFPTATPRITETTVTLARPREENSAAGIALGVVLVTLLFAGMLTWLGSRKPG
jgi:LysM repeat protein